jgi:hypothetical protein
MRNLLIPIFIAMTATSSVFADSVILSCNIPGGETQEIKIIKTQSQNLLLEELNTRGKWQARTLTQKEWQSKIIKLRTEAYKSTSSIEYFNNRWYFSYKTPNWKEQGFASCRN